MAFMLFSKVIDIIKFYQQCTHYIAVINQHTAAVYSQPVNIIQSLSSECHSPVSGAPF